MTLQLIYGDDDTALPLPDAEGGVTLTGQPIGASRRAWDGTLTLDYVATKTRIELHWGALTASELSAILTAWGHFLTQSDTVTLPSGDSYTVVAALNELRYAPWYDGAGTAWWDVGLTLDEV